MLFARLTAILDPEPRGAALNMALDEVLLSHAKEPLMRAYRWANPAVSFGYFGKMTEVAAHWPGRELVRRWTGGGVVPHGEDFTYTLVVPRGHPFCQQAPRESYRLIHAEIGQQLAAAGSEVKVVADSWTKTSDECFANAVQFDLAAGGKKIAGAGQRRTQKGLLHQGSLQVPDLPADFGLRCACGLGEEVVQREITPEVLRAATQLMESKYGSAEWLGKY